MRADQGSQSHMCTQCCVCFALNAQCVTHQMCPSGYLWPHQELEASTHVHQSTTLPQDILVHHLLEQTGTFQAWGQDVGNVLSRYGRDRGMKEVLCSKVGRVTGKRRGREKGKQAAFATAPIYCNVGCRAAVLLHVMLVLGCASPQCMWEATVLWDEKSDCTTLLGLDLVVLLGQRQLKGRHLAPWICAVQRARN